jgi:hypothetical protein
MMAHRIVPAFLAIGWLAVGCDIPPPPQQSTAEQMQALESSKLCQPSLPVFGRFFFPGDVPPGTYIPPNGNIRMNNDGGWCQISHIFVFREVEEVGTMTLAVPPAHGEVRTGTVGKQLRIAYRPAPGFNGIDNFVVHLATPQPWDVPFRVVVEP